MPNLIRIVVYNPRLKSISLNCPMPMRWLTLHSVQQNHIPIHQRNQPLNSARHQSTNDKLHTLPNVRHCQTEEVECTETYLQANPLAGYCQRQRQFDNESKQETTFLKTISTGLTNPTLYQAVDCQSPYARLSTERQEKIDQQNYKIDNQHANGSQMYELTSHRADNVLIPVTHTFNISATQTKPPKLPKFFKQRLFDHKNKNNGTLIHQQRRIFEPIHYNAPTIHEQQKVKVSNENKYDTTAKSHPLLQKQSNNQKQTANQNNQQNLQVNQRISLRSQLENKQEQGGKFKKHRQYLTLSHQFKEKRKQQQPQRQWKIQQKIIPRSNNQLNPLQKHDHKQATNTLAWHQTQYKTNKSQQTNQSTPLFLQKSVTSQIKPLNSFGTNEKGYESLNLHPLQLKHHKYVQIEDIIQFEMNCHRIGGCQ